MSESEEGAAASVDLQLTAKPTSKTGPSMWTMFAVFVALMALLGSTVFFASLPLGAFGLLVALAIAVMKAALVIWFFMHLGLENKTVWVFAGAGMLWLAILFSLTFADYLSRSGAWAGR